METTGSAVAWTSLRQARRGRASFDQPSNHSLLLNGPNPRSSLLPRQPRLLFGYLMANAYITGDLREIIYRLLLPTPACAGRTSS